MPRDAAIALLTILFAFQADASDLTSRRQAALALIPFRWQQLKFDNISVEFDRTGG
jgi:hypothetical protein